MHTKKMSNLAKNNAKYLLDTLKYIAQIALINTQFLSVFHNTCKNKIRELME